MTIRAGAATVAVLVLVAAAPGASAAVPDAAVRVTRITGDLRSDAEDVNARGTVVGGVVTSEEAGPQAYSWSRGRLRLLDPPDAGDFSYGVAVNRRGDVLVYTDHGARLLSGRRWRTFDGTSPIALNDAGEALLFTPSLQDPANSTRALLWSRGHLIELLPPGTPDTSDVNPFALNDAGQVLLGVYGDGVDYDEGTYVWTDGRFVRLQPHEPDAYVAAAHLDERGRVSGYVGTSDNLPVPVVWDRNGRPAVLPLPDGSIGSYVVAANDHGQVVGLSLFADGTQRVTLWTAGRPVLLPDVPGSSLGGDVLINDLGQVAWIERSDENSSGPVGFVWWFGRLVALGDGTVTDIDDGGDIVGYVQPGGDGNPSFALRWTVDWRKVFRRPV